MALTRLDLANRIVEKLLNVGTGQSPEAEDTAKVNNGLERFSDFISEVGIYTIADLDDIDTSAFDWLAEYAAAYFFPADFSLPNDDARGQRAEYMLKRLTAGKPSRETLQVNYF